MPRYGHGKAISSFRTSVGVLRSSRGVIYIPELESYRKSYKNFDPKSVFKFPKKSTFSVEIFVRLNVTLGLWDMSNTSATS